MSFIRTIYTEIGYLYFKTNLVLQVFQILDSTRCNLSKMMKSVIVLRKFGYCFRDYRMYCNYCIYSTHSNIMKISLQMYCTDFISRIIRF
jgi:hypothetical protein